MVKQTEYMGEPGCLELSNGNVSVIVSTNFGPRVLHYGFDDGENIFGWHPGAEVNSELGKWKPYGGHRLWMAPENMPYSYSPDNDPVEAIKESDLSVKLVRSADAAGIGKEMTVTLDEEGNGVTVDHRITNRSEETREMSAWGLTIMRPGGEAIVPNEPFRPYGPETLLPARTMAVWPYTDFTDLRWSFEKDLIRLRVDENSPTPQKFGVLNRQGWVGYKWEGLLFIKRYEFRENAAYPDMNSNTEIYTAGGFVEVETLSPLNELATGLSVEHQERWELHKDRDIASVIGT